MITPIQHGEVSPEDPKFYVPQMAYRRNRGAAYTAVTDGVGAFIASRR